MIYKHAHLEKELREHGRAASAEIVSMRTEGNGGSARGMLAEDDDLTASWTLCRLHLRVMPPGEPSFEATVRTRLCTFKYKGDTVPVLYDPADHDKVYVDYEADAREVMAARDRARVETGSLDTQAAAFREHAEEFEEQAAAFRETGATLAALARAKAAGDQAEVARLKAEMLRQNPPR